jgi:hypothetical protein
MQTKPHVKGYTQSVTDEPFLNRVPQDDRVASCEDDTARGGGSPRGNGALVVSSLASSVYFAYVHWCSD